MLMDVAELPVDQPGSQSLAATAVQDLPESNSEERRRLMQMARIPVNHARPIELASAGTAGLLGDGEFAAVAANWEGSCRS